MPARTRSGWLPARVYCALDRAFGVHHPLRTGHTVEGGRVRVSLTAGYDRAEIGHAWVASPAEAVTWARGRLARLAAIEADAVGV